MKHYTTFLTIFVILIILFILRYFVVFYENKMQIEGFVQKEPFLLKIDQECYDVFYAKQYDILFLPSSRNEIILSILDKTKPFKENNTFLDIGSGTGVLVDTLTKKGYRTFGVDISEDMVEYASNNYPKSIFIEGDIFDPMLFDSNAFTHIFCTEWTLYLWKDKMTFFRNISSWLTSRGYLFLHILHPKTADLVIPVGKPFLIEDVQKYIPKKNNKRIVETSVEFEDLFYKSKFILDHPKSWKWIETFTDKKTKHIRQNERTLYIEEIEDIIILAKQYGFQKIDMYSTHDYYIFKKI